MNIYTYLRSKLSSYNPPVKLGYLYDNTLQPWGDLCRYERILDGKDPGKCTFNGFSVGVHLRHIDYMFSGTQRDLLHKLIQWELNNCTISAYELSSQGKWVAGNDYRHEMPYKDRKATVNIILETGKGWSTLLEAGLSVLTGGVLGIIGLETFSHHAATLRHAHEYIGEPTLYPTTSTGLGAALQKLEQLAEAKIRFLHKLLLCRHGNQKMRIRLTSQVSENFKNSKNQILIRTNKAVIHPTDIITSLFRTDELVKLSKSIDFQKQFGIELSSVADRHQKHSGHKASWV